MKAKASPRGCSSFSRSISSAPATKFEKSWTRFSRPSRRKASQLPKMSKRRRFGLWTDLTELAKRRTRSGDCGRRNEIERVIQVLCRRTKNNPVLIGEAGVGKTAIAEGYGPGDCEAGMSGSFRGTSVWSRLGSCVMVAGTKYRGQFEERIKAVMDESSLQECHSVYRRAAHDRRRRFRRRRDGRVEHYQAGLESR